MIIIEFLYNNRDFEFYIYLDDIIEELAFPFLLNYKKSSGSYRIPLNKVFRLLLGIQTVIDTSHKIMIYIRRHEFFSLKIRELCHILDCLNGINLNIEEKNDYYKISGNHTPLLLSIGHIFAEAYIGYKKEIEENKIAL